MKYIVIVDSQYSQQASLAKLNYSGAHYEILAKGKYGDIVDLAAKLNEKETP